MQEELQADHDTAARDIFLILNWAFLESGVVEGGSSSCDIDILHPAREESCKGHLAIDWVSINYLYSH